ncbi:hypothetical protein C8F04DRAFT_1270644 [Mycena alexandri]|uniref:F-box domain-containing protein n=1 Tax=Mycena alexandri TaxID=1745969 RepID=A0AAD6SAN9_9AGAR|nr:hypothetical protein C8F04DRAFT_1270644 [Mycena alexandri]
MQNFATPWGTPNITDLAAELRAEILAHLPRAALSRILCLSKQWHEFAISTPGLWTRLDFRPGYTPSDLVRAQLWVQRASTRTIAVTVIVGPDPSQPSTFPGILPILSTLSQFPGRIHHLAIEAQDHHSLEIFNFLSNNPLTEMRTLVVLLSDGISDMFHGGLPMNTGGLHVLNTLPNITTLHMANIPFFTGPASHMVELVLGPYIARDVLSLADMGSFLQQMPFLERLGFYGEHLHDCPLPSALLQPPTVFTHPTLTHLSFRRVNTAMLARFLWLFSPVIAELTLELFDHDLYPEETTEELSSLFHDTSFTSHIRTLDVYALSALFEGNTFFSRFPNLQRLGLNFFQGCRHWLWDALVDPKCGGPTFMPALQHISLVDVSPI